MLYFVFFFFFFFFFFFITVVGDRGGGIVKTTSKPRPLGFCGKCCWADGTVALTILCGKDNCKPQTKEGFWFR